MAVAVFEKQSGVVFGVQGGHSLSEGNIRFAAIAVIGRSYDSMSIHIRLRTRHASCHHQSMVGSCFDNTTASDRAGVFSFERILLPVINLVRRATDPRTHAPRRRQPWPSPAKIRLYSTACSITTTISCLEQSGNICSPSNHAVLA